MARLTWDQVDELGAALGAKPLARVAWRYRGIPHKYRVSIVQEAAKRGWIVTLDDLPTGKRVAQRRAA